LKRLERRGIRPSSLMIREESQKGGEVAGIGVDRVPRSAPLAGEIAQP
jgi:hypothetical protein